MHSGGAVRAASIIMVVVGSATAALVPGAAFDRFTMIWLENQDLTQVSQNADWQNLTSQGLFLSNYYALTHPSQPNYIASVGGDYFGLNTDSVVSIPQDVSSVIDLFDTQGIGWKEYMEDIPESGFLGEGGEPPNTGNQWLYQRKHNSLISFDSVNQNETRRNNIVGFDALSDDVKNDALPQFSIIVPNLLNDAHNTTLAYGANWTRTFLNPLLQNPSFTHRTLILLTFDESETYSEPNRVASLLLGGAVPAELRGINDTTYYSHYSISATLENNWGLPNLGRYDVGANVFQVVANLTGYAKKNTATIDPTKTPLNTSYPGYLNTNDKSPGSIPSPNPYLAGAGGKPALAQGGAQAPPSRTVNTPYDGSGAVFDGNPGNAPKYSNVDRARSSEATTADGGPASGTTTTTASVRTTSARAAAAAASRYTTPLWMTLMIASIAYFLSLFA